MSDPQHVLERLRKIERLEHESVPADVLLGEVRALLEEAEAWVRSEGRANEQAEAAVRGLREALAHGEETALSGERTLVA